MQLPNTAYVSALLYQARNSSRVGTYTTAALHCRAEMQRKIKMLPTEGRLPKSALWSEARVPPNFRCSTGRQPDSSHSFFLSSFLLVCVVSKDVIRKQIECQLLDSICFLPKRRLQSLGTTMSSRSVLWLTPHEESATKTMRNPQTSQIPLLNIRRVRSFQKPMIACKPDRTLPSPALWLINNPLPRNMTGLLRSKHSKTFPSVYICQASCAVSKKSNHRDGSFLCCVQEEQS